MCVRYSIKFSARKTSQKHTTAERKLKIILLARWKRTQLKHDWERILNVWKSSWSTCIEVKWDVDIYYRPIAAKLTPQILRPEHRKYKYDSTDHHGKLYLHHQPAGRAAGGRAEGTFHTMRHCLSYLEADPPVCTVPTLFNWRPCC